MALTDDQKKMLLVGGGIGALAIVVTYALFGGRQAAAAPSQAAVAPGTAAAVPDTSVRPIRPSPRVPSPRIPLPHHSRKRRRDDDGERGENGERGERGENGRGEYARNGQRRRYRGD